MTYLGQPESENDTQGLHDVRGQSPEELHGLRVLVESWLAKARESIWRFSKTDGVYAGTFLRDSSDKDSQHLRSTTTARCYMALVYAERQIGSSKEDDSAEDWRKELTKCLGNINFEFKNGTIVEHDDTRKNDSSQGKEELNNFEIAHHMDFFFAIQNFGKQGVDVFRTTSEETDNSAKTSLSKLFSNKSARSKFERILINRIGVVTKASQSDDSKDAQPDHNKDGEVFFDSGDDDSRHFFVTLHTLRALSISGYNLREDESVQKIVENAKKFCIEQCFFCHRGLRHHQDPARLVFAGVIYCLFAENADREVLTAIVDAIAEIQQGSGKWPTTRPMIRKSKPWYIASPELALSLTWLYFQPNLPDEARKKLLGVYEKHFREWLIPTYRSISEDGKPYSGWYDDSAAGSEKVVGWVTAIVCHFLANYSAIVNDHINRRVIESLGIQNEARRYLIDETTANKNTRWKTFTETGNPWPDLPTICEQEKPILCEELEKRISWEWSDPRDDAELAKRLAKNVLAPILVSSGQWPGEKAAGILDGPPGTRKTSLVKVLSKILEWPYVPVPASAIFGDGFDNMEIRSTIVFRRLNYLTQCVVFFDEFEEFVRDRTIEAESTSSPSSRTIAAFTTSAMLPRFQDLRDQGRSLIFLATNDVEKIDDAIKRAGRFDFIEKIDYPTVSRFCGENGYFFNPGRINLENWGVTYGAKSKGIDDPKAITKIGSVCEAVNAALRTDDVKKLLIKVQKVLSDRNSSTEAKYIPKKKDTKCENEFCDSEIEKLIKEDMKDCRIMFDVVEAAATEASKAIPSGEVDNSGSDDARKENTTPCVQRVKEGLEKQLNSIPGAQQAKVELEKQLEAIRKNKGSAGELE